MEKQYMKNLLQVTLILALAAGLSACHKNVKDDANADLLANNGTTTEMVLEETTVTEAIPAQVSLGSVHFALDTASLTAEARKIIEANVKAIKAVGGDYNVVVEGNCDDSKQWFRRHLPSLTNRLSRPHPL